MATIHWANGVSGDFATAADWTGGVVPGAGDTAIIDPSGTYTVTLDKAQAVNSLTLNDATATVVNTGTLTLGSNLTVSAGTFALDQGGEIVGGTLSASKGAFLWNGGTLSGVTYDGALNLTAAHAAVIVTDGLTVTGVNGTGPGTINISGSVAGITTEGSETLDNATLNIGSNQSIFDIQDTGSGALTLGSNFKIVQAGTLVEMDTGGAASLVNNGSISAGFSGGTFELINLDFTNDGSVSVSNKDALIVGDNVIRNLGTMTASSSGTLIIEGPTLTGTGIVGANGGNVDLWDLVITGGTLESSGAFGVHVSKDDLLDELDGTKSAVTNQGRLFVNDNESLSVQGMIHNSGELVVQSGADTTTLQVTTAGVTLDSGGLVYMDNRTGSLVEGATSSATLTNVDNTVLGGGNLGDGAMGLVNETKGTIAGEGLVGLTVDVGGNTITNAGLIEGATAAGATIKSAVANTGVLKADDGDLTLDGAVTGSGRAVIDGGKLDVASSFTENVAFTGKNSELILAQSQAYSGTITGFGNLSGDSFDLLDIGFVSAKEATFVGTASGGTLTVTDGTHTASIHLSGNYLSSTFTASSDGHGGTTVVDPRAPGAHAFNATIAAFHPQASTSLTEPAHDRHTLAILLTPPGLQRA